MERNAKKLPCLYSKCWAAQRACCLVSIFPRSALLIGMWIAYMFWGIRSCPRSRSSAFSLRGFA